MKTNTCASTNFSGRLKGTMFGLLLVIAGLLFLSFNFGWIDPALRPVLFSWPMLLIVAGILKFSSRDLLMPIVLLIVGVFFLLPRIAAAYPDSFPGLDGNFAHTYWPMLLILLGVGLILRVFSKKQYHMDKHPYFERETLNDVSGRIEKRVLFGGSESIFLDPVFHGGELSATFGGIVVDLRRTTLPEGETCLDVNATFGGVELYIPGDWVVETRFQTVLGGMEDKRLVSTPDYARKLILRGDLIFGGCEIR